MNEKTELQHLVEYKDNECHNDSDMIMIIMSTQRNTHNSLNRVHNSSQQPRNGGR